MSSVLLLVLAAFWPQIAITKNTGSTTLVAEIPNMRGCPGVPDNACVFLGPASSTLRGRGNYTFNAAYNISRTVRRRISEIRLDITRCREVVSSNTCEHFHSWRLVQNPCKAWLDPAAPWGGFLKATEEDYTCPTKVGTYHVRDAVIDMRTLQALHLPLEGSVWRTKVFFLEPAGSVHYCMEGTFMFRRVRS